MYVTLSHPYDDVIDGDQTLFDNVTNVPGHTARPIRVGQYLFREGDEANHLYQVRSGLLRLTRVLENGARQVIAFALPGDIVGFPDGEHYHSDCDVLAEGEVITYRRHALDKCISDPVLHQHLMKAALREISAMQDHFMTLARKSAPEKVASFLMVMADRVGTLEGAHTRVELKMKRADIADFLGLTIETVCRAITKLRRTKIIALEDAQTVLIINPNALANAALSD